MSIDTVRQFAEAEYRDLITQLSLAAVENFHVFETREGSDRVVAEYEKAGKKVPILESEVIAAYRPGLLIMSFEGWDLETTANRPSFPPVWETYRAWPRWRSTLWHEVCHQHQHQVLDAWNPLDGAEGHAAGWNESLVAIAQAFDMKQAEFEAFVDEIWGPAERPLSWKYPQVPSPKRH